MHPRAAPGFPREQPTAVHFDRRQFRGAGHLGRQLPLPVLHRVVVAGLGHFDTGLAGQAADVTGADVQVGGHGQGLRCLREGVERGRQRDDLAQEGRAIAVAVQAEGGPEGGKSPGGSRDSDRKARLVESDGRL